jgi:hypothetical protein
LGHDCSARKAGDEAGDVSSAPHRQISPAEFLERFRSWPEGPFDGAVEPVNNVRARYG